MTISKGSYADIAHETAAISGSLSMTMKVEGRGTKAPIVTDQHGGGWELVHRPMWRRLVEWIKGVKYYTFYKRNVTSSYQPTIMISELQPRSSIELTPLTANDLGFKPSVYKQCAYNLDCLLEDGHKGPCDIDEYL